MEVDELRNSFSRVAIAGYLPVHLQKTFYASALCGFGLYILHKFLFFYLKPIRS